MNSAAHWIVPMLVAAAIFSITLNGTFVYDDVLIILEDVRLANPARWGELWVTSYNFNADNLYRPMLSQSLAVQVWMDAWFRGGAISRPIAWPFHLVNLILHAAASAMVGVLAFRLSRRTTSIQIARQGGLFAGLLFAVHPIHVEAVAGLVGRSDMICAIGILGVLIVMLGERVRPWQAVAAGVGLLVAVLTKEFALLTFVLAGLLVLMTHLQRRPTVYEKHPGRFFCS